MRVVAIDCALQGITRRNGGEMSKKLIGAMAVIVVAGGTALATAAGGGGSGARPDYATVTIDLSGKPAAGAKGLAGGGGGTKKPRLVYLVDADTPINPADPAAGGVGPYVDVRLTGCKKVVDGNVVPDRLDVYSQGTYVESPSIYHALIAIDEESLGDRTPFTVDSNLTCLKGVK
jgi:hypothetical protein